MTLSTRLSSVIQTVFHPIRFVLKFLHSHKIKTILLVVIGVPAVALTMFIMAPDKVEFITAEVERGDLYQTVEAVGSVISEKDLDLKFPLTGLVEQVLVDEGDIVIVGQELALLRTTSISADVASASAKLQAARAELRALEEGARPEDIAITQAEVENKKASLQAAQATLESAEANLENSLRKLKELNLETDIGLIGYVQTARSTISEQITTAQNSLNVFDDVFQTTIVENAVEFQQARTFDEYSITKKLAENVLLQTSRIAPLTHYADALSGLRTTRDALTQTSEAANKAYAVILSLNPTSYFSVSVKETQKNTIATERDTVQDAIKSIDSAIKSLQDASANYRTQIATEDGNVSIAQGKKDTALADILTFQTSLRIQEAQLELRKAGTRQADIDASKARVNQAYADVRRVQAQYEDHILRAPIAGSITKVSLKEGEFTGDFDNTSRSITMLGDSPYRIEVHVSEIDIPKVTYSQTGVIALDAYPNRDFFLSVTEIDPAATDIDGVPKYRIKLDFIDDEEDSLKIGMTGDVDIITDVRVDTIYVPARAVIDNNVVRVRTGEQEYEERIVDVGMETDTEMEILSGLSIGEEVILLIKD
ncbi:MAG: HlyD family efflux transporter periplasmic adaptor subunit [bacterium]|nr:HlyD family efflux transporter periplasmic adaptor subunit [bacterium]